MTELPELKESQKIITLLEEQTRYLKSIENIAHKEHRDATTGRIIHAILILVPSLIILILGYYLWTGIMHYLDALNNNINLLRSNYETLIAFFQKLIPDFSKIGNGLEQTWQNIQFWKQS